MFKFSCADYTFPVLDRLDALRLLHLLGFTHVDIGLFARSAQFSSVDLKASPSSYTGQVLNDLKAAELRASDVFLQIGAAPSECAANDPDAAVRQSNRDVFALALDFCIAVESSHLTGLPGVLHSSVSREQDWQLAVEETAWRVAQCAKAGIRYSVEAHVDSICPDVKSTQAFLQAVEGLTLTLDYGHFIMQGETSEKVHDLLPFASHIHIRGGDADRLQTSVQENTIDFDGMIPRLQQLDYAGFLALEYVWVDWKGCNRTDNLSETVLLRSKLELLASSQAKPTTKKE